MYLGILGLNSGAGLAAASAYHRLNTLDGKELVAWN